MGLSESLATDDLTILLGLTTASIFLLYNLYKPQPLVHPILLGRQSDVARVRMPGESAVHRNYSTGLMGRVRVHLCVFIHGHLHAECSLTLDIVHNPTHSGGLDPPRSHQARVGCASFIVVRQGNALLWFCCYEILKPSSPDI
jgi:hypothetical protein